MKHRAYLVVIAMLSLTISACGTIASPAPLFTQTPTSVVDAMTAQAVAAQATTAPTTAPTETPIPATETPVPATSAPAEPTTAPTSAPVVANDPISILVSLADPARGEEIFNTEYNTANGPYRCITCHLVDSEDRLIGPGLLNFVDHANHRTDEAPAVYAYNSIVHPNDYIVEGYVANLMPANYGDILSDDDLYHLVAYILSLTE